MSDIAVPPPAGFVDNTVLLNPNPIQQGAVIKPKKKRNLPGTPDPNAEVIALSPRTLMATNRFVCEVCKKGFQRDQNLQLHRRGHNLPWKLRQRNGREIRKRVYVCPEMSCVHHHPSRALGDLTGIKKHFSRKHGEKKWKCEKCSKKYAVQTDWKAHSKTCGTREYRCDCGTLFSRKDSFVTHRAFCDAMAEASARATSLDTKTTTTNNNNLNYKSTNPPATSNMVVPPFTSYNFSPILRPNFPALNGEMSDKKPSLSLWLDQQLKGSITTPNFFAHPTVSLPEFTTGLVQLAPPPPPPPPPPVSLFGGMKEEGIAMGSKGNLDSFFNNPNHQADNNPHMSATALLQKAAQMGATSSNPCAFAHGFGVSSSCDMLMGLNQNQFRVLMGGEEEKQPTENLHDMMNSLSSYGMFFQGGSGNADGFLGMLVAEGKQEGESEAEGVVLPYFSRGEQGSRVHVNQEVENGLTRDFLGVGRDSGGGPFTQRELAKMASIRSAMDLNPYNSAH